MNENQNWNGIGEQIRDAVQGALDSGDFRQLNDMVAGTVSSALSEAKRQMKMAAGDVKRAADDVRNAAGDVKDAGRDVVNGFKGNDTFHYRTRYDSRNRGNRGRGYGPGGAGYANGRAGAGYANGPGGAGYRNGRAGAGFGNGSAGTGYANGPGGAGYPGNAAGTQVRNMANSLVTRVKTRRVGNVAGTLYMVFGGIGTGIMAIALLIFIIMMMVGAASSILGGLSILSGGLLLAFLIMIERGCVKKERLKRAQRYVALCNGNTYINIEDLAMHMGKSERFIRKDVKKMLKLGIFPEGHLDQRETCLMLDDATYREYLSLEKQRKAQELEAKVAAMKDKKAPRQPQVETAQKEEIPNEQAQTAPEVNPELEALISQGQDCIRRLRDMNDSIEGEVISAKLFQLENLLKEIFDRIKEHPEQMSQMQKFMNYYLPTTLKLVQAYSEFDSISAPGEDIISAKAEIEKTLDTINKAFVELLNNLFRDSVFDVTTDAQVLQTMLAKEGLTRDMEFEKVPR